MDHVHERWDLDARASYNLRPYVGLRTPMVQPLGESRDVRDFFPELARGSEEDGAVVSGKNGQGIHGKVGVQRSSEPGNRKTGAR